MTRQIDSARPRVMAVTSERMKNVEGSRMKITTNEGLALIEHNT